MLQMTGMNSVGSLPMRLHSREKNAQCALRQYSSEPSPSPSIAAYSAVTLQYGTTSELIIRVTSAGSRR